MITRARKPRLRDDSGSALLAAVAITFLVLAMGMATSVVVLSSNRASGLDRQRTQALAAAESGLDMALSAISATARRDLESVMPCGAQPTVQVPASPDPINVTYTVSYVDAVNPAVPLSCPLVNGMRPVTATVVSNAVPSRTLGGGGSTGDRSMKTTIQLSGGTATSAPPFARAVFSDGALALTNTFATVGGSAYTNGSYSCNSNGTIDGSVTAQGDVSLTNACVINGDVVTAGKFSCNSAPLVMGSVQASGTAESSLTNTCTIKKDLWTGGPVRMTSTPRIERDLTTSTGGLTVQSTARVLGNTRLGGTATVSDGQPVTVPLRGTLLQNSPQAVPAAPAVQEMPPVAYQASDWTGFTVTTWASWIGKNANDNGAPSWSAARSTPCNAIAGANYSLNGPLRNDSNLLVDATACTGVSLNAVSLQLKGDLTLFVKDFSSTNGLTVTSQDGLLHKLRIIVPATNTADVCSSVSPGGIVFNSGGTVINDKIQLLLYTPGKVTLTNTVDFYGSIYSCKTDVSVGTTIRYADVTPPGGVSNAWTTYSIKDVGPRFEATR